MKKENIKEISTDKQMYLTNCFKQKEVSNQNNLAS